MGDLDVSDRLVRHGQVHDLVLHDQGEVVPAARARHRVSRSCQGTRGGRSSESSEGPLEHSLAVLVRDLGVLPVEFLEDALHDIEEVARLRRELGQHGLALRERGEGVKSVQAGSWRRDHSPERRSCR